MNILNQVKNLDSDSKLELLDLLEELESAKKREKSQQNFLSFVGEMWSAFIHGKHHEIMAEAFEKVARGEIKRLIINMPPRHTKSEFASYLFPAWMMGLRPNAKLMQVSHNAELSFRFGRKVRNLVDSDEYKKIFFS